MSALRTWLPVATGLALWALSLVALHPEPEMYITLAVAVAAALTAAVCWRLRFDVALGRFFVVLFVPGPVIGGAHALMSGQVRALPIAAMSIGWALFCPVLLACMSLCRGLRSRRVRKEAQPK